MRQGWTGRENNKYSFINKTGFQQIYLWFRSSSKKNSNSFKTSMESSIVKWSIAIITNRLGKVLGSCLVSYNLAGWTSNRLKHIITVSRLAIIHTVARQTVESRLHDNWGTCINSTSLSMIAWITSFFITLSLLALRSLDTTSVCVSFTALTTDFLKLDLDRYVVINWILYFLNQMLSLLPANSSCTIRIAKIINSHPQILAGITYTNTSSVVAG